ncbi:MAG: methionine--tRNA ligase [Thermoprotei archaeon]
MARWLVTAAWPTSSDIPHLGNMVGSVLSADVFARFLRISGHQVVFVSGSDHHGTPLEVEALKRGLSPQMLAEENHQKISQVFKSWEISFDNYTNTESEVHKKFVREHYMKIYSQGEYIFVRAEQIHFCPRDNRFLPDRFVEGTCPNCGYKGARGDQCENCGRPLEAQDLIDPRCIICGGPTVIKETKQWFFDLPKFSDYVSEYLDKSRLSSNVVSFSKAWIREGLRPRSITRDSKWGIPAPFPGAEGKTIYVWMEDVLGYVSAVVEYFQRLGREEEWKEYWFRGDSNTSFFIGKDNIPFHSILLPSLLHASGEPYTTPTLISSTEFLTFGGQKFSKSRKIGIWCDEALNLMPADYWRYVLIANRPETGDTDLDWKSIERTINGELNDTLGNLVNRTLVGVQKFSGGEFTLNSSELTDMEKKAVEDMVRRHDRIGENYASAELKSAYKEALEQGFYANRYLSDNQPWKTYSSDRQRSLRTLYVALTAIKLLCLELYPIIPKSCELMAKQADLFKNSDTAWTWKNTGLDHELPIRVDRVSPLFHKVEATKLIESLNTSRSPKATGRF